MPNRRVPDAVFLGTGTKYFLGRGLSFILPAGKAYGVPFRFAALRFGWSSSGDDANDSYGSRFFLTGVLKSTF